MTPQVSKDPFSKMELVYTVTLLPHHWSDMGHTTELDDYVCQSRSPLSLWRWSCCLHTSETAAFHANINISGMEISDPVPSRYQISTSCHSGRRCRIAYFEGTIWLGPWGLGGYPRRQQSSWRELLTLSSDRTSYFGDNGDNKVRTARDLW